MKKMALVLLALIPMSLTLQGCDDTTAAIGVGAVGGALVGAAIADGGHHRGGYNTYGSSRRCNTYTNRWGQRVSECRPVYGYYNSRGGYYRGGRGDFNYNRRNHNRYGYKAVETGSRIDTRVADFAKKYQIGFDSARQVAVAFDRAAHSDLSGFQAMGVGYSDLENINAARMPADATISQVSQKLDMPTATAKRLFKDSIATTKRLRAAGKLPAAN